MLQWEQSGGIGHSSTFHITSAGNCSIHREHEHNMASRSGVRYGRRCKELAEGIRHVEPNVQPWRVSLLGKPISHEGSEPRATLLSAVSRPRQHLPCRAAWTPPSRRGYASQTGGDEIKKTPLYDLHASKKAKFVPFGGYSMPLYYGDLSHAESHHWTREKASIFDVSHMYAATFLSSAIPSAKHLRQGPA